MGDRTSLTLFAHVVGRTDDEIDLAQAALLIAEPEYPGLDFDRTRATLDDLGRGLARTLSNASTDPIMRTRRLLTHLYEEIGFHGNRDDYYDPKNSFLNEVVARRTGIPITLAIVIIEAARRAGIEARGVSFPGHFLVRFEAGEGTLLADPFAGKLVDRSELRTLHQRATGSTGDPPSRLLEPATRKQILLRVLANLKSIYAERKDEARLCAIVERMQAIAPTAELREEVARLGGTAPWPTVRGKGVN